MAKRLTNHPPTDNIVREVLNIQFPREGEYFLRKGEYCPRKDDLYAIVLRFFPPPRYFGSVNYLCHLNYHHACLLLFLFSYSLFVCPSVCLSVCLTVRLFVRLCVCLCLKVVCSGSPSARGRTTSSTLSCGLFSKKNRNSHSSK